MDQRLRDQLDGLLSKYTELLLGETNDELKDQIQAWILYTHIAKSMPPLAKHWNETYPDGREEIKNLIVQIKALNEQYRKEKNT